MVRRTSPKAALTELSIAEIRALLEKKLAQDRTRLTSLKAKRSKVASQLQKLESEIAAIEGAKPIRRRVAKKRAVAVKRVVKKAAKRKAKPAKKAAAKRQVKTKVARKKITKRGGRVTLPQAIGQVLKAAGKPMRLSEIKEAIIQQKLLANISKSFSLQVSHALGSHKEFKKVERGVYTL